MRYPSLSEYNAAVLSPRSAFTDPVLARGKAAMGGLGMPLVLSGGFALTYRFRCAAGRQYAVRLFQEERPGREERYRAVGAWLRRHGAGMAPAAAPAAGGAAAVSGGVPANAAAPAARCWVPTAYQPGGVRIAGEAFPLVKMNWVNGKTLGALIEEQRGNGAVLELLRERIGALAAYLETSGVVHGDIQNGNVFWTDSGLRLIDYDGMCVPGMVDGAGAAGETGHPNFQHPARTAGDRGVGIDRFSLILYETSLRALAAESALFEQFSTGENILFSRKDLIAPAESAVFQALGGSAELASEVGLFQEICEGPLNGVPSLADFLREAASKRVAGVGPAAGPAPARRPAPAKRETRTAVPEPPEAALRPTAPGLQYLGPYRVLDGRDFEGLRRAAGSRVEVVGRVDGVKQGVTRLGKPYVFVNFGFWRGDIFRINIWSEGLRSFPERPDESWKGRWISVMGLVDEPYHNDRYGYTHASVTVHDPSQIRRIDAEEAAFRLGRDGPKRRGGSAESRGS